MKRSLLILISLWSVVFITSAQTVILDFESPETSTTFQYFGSGLDGMLNEIVANPDATGVNTSSMVANHIKPAVAEVWAGCFSNPNPQVAIDLAANGMIELKVYMDHIGTVSLKLEASTNGGDNWITTVSNTLVNEWETLTFDPSLPSIEAPNTPAAGFTYTRVVLFFDLGTGGTGEDVTSYFDDLVAIPVPPMETVILDFEDTATTTTFQYFGSSLDGSLTAVVPNPNPSGIDTSSMVTEFIKPANALVWAGAFSNPNPQIPVDLSNGGQVCVKVHMDHIGNLALKLENSATGNANWIQQVSNTLVGEWEELCFDASLPSLEPPFETAGGIYNTITLFFDFGIAGGDEDVISYIDDIVVVASSGPQIRLVTFKVDMNQYTENFDQVYVSGTFNNWSGDANPLEDPEFDGIWEGSIMVPNGLYEYKVTLDNWAGQESFTGTEECTKTDPSGQFTNRFLPVSADIDLPVFCYNSCYACGDEVLITFRLGMGDVTPSPDGVWLAGGGNFDVPGGKYKMNDDDGDEIYEIVVPRQLGFSSYYTFANGNCPDYSCKENLEGLSCAHPENFNDRFLPAVESNTEVATCFGTCHTNAECTSGFASLTKDKELFSLYGNPATDEFSVLVFGDQDNAGRTVLVTNALGSVIQQWELSSGAAHFQLPTASLPAGMYFITVTTGNRFLTQKLIR